MTRHRGHPLDSDEGRALATAATDRPQQVTAMIDGALQSLIDTEDRRRCPVGELRRAYLRGVAAMALVTAAADGERRLTGWELRPNPIRGDQVTGDLLAKALKALTAALWARRELARRQELAPWVPQEHEAAMQVLRRRLLVAARGRLRRVAT